MQNESSACTILKNSIIEDGGWACKIPDPSSVFAKSNALPFDHFGVMRGHSWYAEVKFLSELKSFDLQRIEDHQIANLCQIKELNPSSWCWVVLAVKVDRGDNRFYIFDDPFEIESRRHNRKNYLKKELETLSYLSVKKGLVDFSGLFARKTVPTN